jgi:DNA-binding transcriptional ArsR family regulator
MAAPTARVDRAAAGAVVSDKALEAVLATVEPTRLKILFLIGGRGRMCVGEIAARFKISRPAISHHLKVLKTSGLVETEREGQEIYYSVRMDALVETLRSLADALDNCCGKGSAR